MKKFKKKSGVFTLLIRNYIFFTIALVLILFVSLYFLLFYTVFKLSVTVHEQIINYESDLLNGNYNHFPAEQLLGRDGFIVVLDQAGNAIYNADKIETSTLSNNLELVQDFLDNNDMQHYVFSYISSTGEKNYEFRYTEQQSDASHTEVYILDYKGNLLYSQPNAKYEDLTNEQWMLLTQTKFDEFEVYKYSLSNQNTVLLFSKKSLDIDLIDKMVNVFRDSFILFIIIYVGMILAFIVWLKRKITKPLSLLCKNIDSFEVGDNVITKYKGPREFAEIFDSFSRLSRKLSVSEERRKNAEEEKQKMLADIAHDLKTPITVIQGYTKALCNGLISQEEQKVYLEIINQRANSLNGLINTFFEYSKLEHPKYVLKIQKVDICTFFRTYLADKYTEIEAAGFNPDAEIPEEQIMSSIDTHQMKRVFDNIISNAIKHNPKGTALCFLLVKNEDMVKITIGDNGVGISTDVASRIFTPFVVGEASRQGSGTGLGLAIAQKIVDAHDGNISLVQDNPEWKTIFEITLPIFK